MPACVRHFWLRLLAVTALLYTLMAGAAELLHSYRGEAGLIIAALVLAAALTADRLLFSGAFLRSLRELGLHAPACRGLLAAAVISAALIASLPLAARASGATLSLRADWLWLIPGLLAQAGLAEELVFRGFVFGRIRATRAFWRAVLLSIGPFALVHMALFFSMPPAIAAASLMLSIVTCAPLAQLYELGGRTIWPAALVHATVQGAIKLVDIEGGQLLPLIWIGACAILPWAAFLWRRAEP
ncbi:MAG: CPBP family intramembrane metalloprotease [Hyphomonadaceae bacterium]|nr:CPBP family intramembrane metalloprotease [Hyphomonadaceae bacterium]